MNLCSFQSILQVKFSLMSFSSPRVSNLTSTVGPVRTYATGHVGGSLPQPPLQAIGSQPSSSSLGPAGGLWGLH